jgi:hypothetical protein
MSEPAVVNLIAKNGSITVLNHRWGVLEEIIPALMKCMDAKTTEAMASALYVYEKQFTHETTTKAELANLLVQQRKYYLFSYNLFETEDGWDIEVWSGDRYAIVLVTEEQGYVCGVRMNAQNVIPRMLLRKLTKKAVKAANVTMEKERQRVIAEEQEHRKTKPFGVSVLDY